MAKKSEKTFLDKIKLDFKYILGGSILLNVLFLILGIVIYLNPVITANTVGVLIGIYFILLGLFNIYEFLLRSYVPIFTSRILAGILIIILGFFIMFNPFHIIKILTFALGIYLIVLALCKAVEAFQFKKYNYDGWLLMFVISILLLIFGIFITINPMASMDIIKAAGIFIILSSILEICNLIAIYSKSKEIVKLFKKM